jgi:hypothetical protein
MHPLLPSVHFIQNERSSFTRFVRQAILLQDEQAN